MASVGIFVGSSGGVTLEAAEKLQELFEGSELINMEEDYDDLEQFDEFDVILFHIDELRTSTWGQGDPQRDWVDPLYEIENDEPDFTGKKAAFFGAGDQKTHGEHFVSALGKMEELFHNRGAKTGFGHWPTDGYEYEFSLAEKGGRFCGLPIDDVNQADLTDERLEAWAAQVKTEMGL